MDQSLIRNFCIIAHVDHGKSTLADRLLVMTNTVTKEKIGEQFLDSNPISRERGITIKLAPVRMYWTVESSKLKVQSLDQNSNSQLSTLNSQLSKSVYALTLIDTPGHVDFSYEVVRTLYACEGAILLVDATKGIQAQTVAHYTIAKKLGLTIIPVINKVDLPSANVEKVENDMYETFGFAKENILRISAKTGLGVEALLQRVIDEVPSPQGESKDALQALIFDSVYDEHRGVIIYTRVRNGQIKKGDEILFTSDKKPALVLDVGYMHPNFTTVDSLVNGEVGYVNTNIKDISIAKVGDTITLLKNPAPALPGYIPIKPFVFLSIYPASTSDFATLRKALFTLKLNDASLEFIPEQSNIFGPGFRCGFLGLLHAQIIIERVEREFDIDVFAAPPSIEYIIDGVHVTNPRDFDMSKKEVLEPYIKGEIYTPYEYLGGLLELIHKKRGENADVEYFGSQVRISFFMPLATVIYDFYDKIKSLSQGFASFDYEIVDYRASNLVKVDISVNDKVISELSFIVHKSEADTFGRSIVEKLSKSIPKHQFVINVRAQIGMRVTATEKIAALSKNVLAKMSGGDVTRKNKLLDKQKKGKERMKQVGNVGIPKEAFMSVLEA